MNRVKAWDHGIVVAMAITLAGATSSSTARAEVIHAYRSAIGTLPTAQGWSLTDTGGSPAPTMVGGELAQGPTGFSTYQYWEKSGVPFDFATQTVTMTGTLKIISSTLNMSPVVRGLVQHSFCKSGVGLPEASVAS